MFHAVVHLDHHHAQVLHFDAHQVHAARIEAHERHSHGNTQRQEQALYESLCQALQDTPETATQRVEIRAALQARQEHPSALVREHVAWALTQG